MARTARSSPIVISAINVGDTITISVRDQGIGIPADSLEAVFDRYSRLATVKTRTIEGTGLGLPIVRQICQAHGGRAWAESTLGSGSTFHVSLPFDQRTAAQRVAV